MSPRIQGTTGEAMTALHAISRTIGEMSEIATGIAGAMEQQSTSTQETVGLTEASGAVGASAGEVLGDADGLSQQSDRLREQMQQFLARVRAA